MLRLIGGEPRKSTLEEASLLKRYIYPLRVMAVAFLLAPIMSPKIFYDHFTAYITGSAINRIITGEWGIVLLSTVVFISFLVPLSFRRNVKWSEYGIVTAFFISLFIEMYGIPFTILFAQHWFFEPTIAHPPNIVNFWFLGVYFGMDLPMVYAAMLMTVGATLVIVGWITLYLGVKNGRIVTSGIYSYCRHPQYLGFIMIIVGWLVGWPTLLTIVIAPILIFKYIRLARDEERNTIGSAFYDDYRHKVPFLI